MHKTQDKFKIKKKIRINSLQAAICNVALFKSMKDKDFRDTIFISYCEQGVILEAITQQQWKKAHEHIQSFLHNKKIQLLIDGYDKDAYEALINKGLKQITRKIRQSDEECPYINIIHYQKLRKSCQYMDKEHYVQPLKDWQKKNKKNPNFAFLIVQPKYKFDQIKRNLLQYLLNQQISLKITTIQPIQLMYILFYCPNKQTIRNNCNRRQIQISLEKQQQDDIQILKAINFTNINLNQYDFSIIRSQNKITKSGIGLQSISASDIKNQIKNAKIYCKDNPTQLIQSCIGQLQQQYGQNFIIVPYKHQQKQKYKNIIQKYTNAKYTKQEIQKKLQSHQIFTYEQIQFIDQIYTTKKYQAWKVCINGCPYMIHQYNINNIDVDSFLIYLDQLALFYCTYLVRYYGIIVKRMRNKDYMANNQVVSYLIVFDYHRNNLLEMLENDMILDSMQVAMIVLQLLYLINYLHSHQQPRFLGSIEARQIFWPMAAVLPYLGLGDDQPIYSIQNDIKQAGTLMQQLLGDEQDQQFIQLISKMTNSSKNQRISVKKAISQLQDMLCL